MEHLHGSSHMHQKIFSMGLSTESISAYLLCCSLADEKTPITIENLTDIWTGNPETLKQSMQDLQERHILKRMVSDDDADAVFQLRDVHDWVDR